MDLHQGTLILGCGGGGNPRDGLDSIDKVYGSGLQFTLASLDDLPEDTVVATIGLVGGGVSEAELKEVEGFQPVEDAVLRAVDELATFIGQDIGALMPCEPGAGNSFVPLYAGALRGIPTLDADTAGRAKPEIVNSTTSLFGVSLTPLAIVSDFGDHLIIREAADEFRVEQLCRYIARASGGLCAVARCPIRAGEMRGKFIEGALSEALAAGRAIRESCTPVAALLDALGAIRLFDGEIYACSRREEGGFMWGEIELKGMERDSGKRCRLWYKNENLLGWIDDVLRITAPDLIALVDAHTGEGIYNWDSESLLCGRRCSVIVREAHALWRSPRGLELFGPRHFGFDTDYVTLVDDPVPTT